MKLGYIPIDIQYIPIKYTHCCGLYQDVPIFG